VKFVSPLIVCTTAALTLSGCISPLSGGPTSGSIDDGSIGKNSEAKSKDKQLFANMKEIQMAAEHYAANHDGVEYPDQIDDAFKSYMTGGGDDGRTARPVGFINPYAGGNEWPVIGSITNVDQSRNSPRPAIQPGKIEYSVIDGGKGYAIIGGTYDGKALTDYDGKVLILSNFSEYYPPKYASPSDRTNQ
jgi:hypothetical protein